jgi:hypothetical protein
MLNRHVRQQLISIQALGKNIRWPGTDNFFAFGTTLAFQMVYNLVHFVVPHKVLSSLLWTTRSPQPAAMRCFFLIILAEFAIIWCLNTFVGD